MTANATPTASPERDTSEAEDPAIRWLSPVLVLTLGCSGLFGRTDAFHCPLGATAHVDPPGEGTDRELPDTELHTCVDGSGARVGMHQERFADGGVAAEGRWKDGKRDDVWIRWYPDGAFAGSTTWKDGVEDGVSRSVASDERITEVELHGGEASGWRVLPLGTPMPEWDGSKQVDGTKYREHAAPPAPEPSPEP